MGYKLKFTRQAEKDARLLEEIELEKPAARLLAIIKNNPYQNPPTYEKLQQCYDSVLRRFYFMEGFYEKYATD